MKWKRTASTGIGFGSGTPANRVWSSRVADSWLPWIGSGMVTETSPRNQGRTGECCSGRIRNDYAKGCKGVRRQVQKRTKDHGLGKQWSVVLSWNRHNDDDFRFWKWREKIWQTKNHKANGVTARACLELGPQRNTLGKAQAFFFFSGKMLSMKLEETGSDTFRQARVYKVWTFSFWRSQTRIRIVVDFGHWQRREFCWRGSSCQDVVASWSCVRSFACFFFSLRETRSWDVENVCLFGCGMAVNLDTHCLGSLFSSAKLMEIRWEIALGVGVRGCCSREEMTNMKEVGGANASTSHVTWYLGFALLFFGDGDDEVLALRNWCGATISSVCPDTRGWRVRRIYTTEEEKGLCRMEATWRRRNKCEKECGGQKRNTKTWLGNDSKTHEDAVKKTPAELIGRDSESGEKFQTNWTTFEMQAKKAKTGHAKICGWSGDASRRSDTSGTYSRTTWSWESTKRNVDTSNKGVGEWTIETKSQNLERWLWHRNLVRRKTTIESRVVGFKNIWRERTKQAIRWIEWRQWWEMVTTTWGDSVLNCFEHD